MSENLLRSNFQVKKPIVIEEDNKPVSKLEDYHQKALVSIGGSMVYMERKTMVWDGEEKTK